MKKNKNVQHRVKPKKELYRSKQKMLFLVVKKRLLILLLIIIVSFVFLDIELSKINFYDKDPYKIQVLSQQQYSSKILPYKRGEILDRNGNVLALSVKTYNVILDPKVINDKEEYLEPTVSAIVKCFSKFSKDEEGKRIDFASIKEIISSKSESNYVILLKNLSYDDIKTFSEIQNDNKKNPYVKGVWFETEYERKYPYDSIGCTALGFAENSNTASIGIESSYSSELNGTDGRQYGSIADSDSMEKIIREPQDGNNIISTLDLKIQSIVENKIEEFQKEIKSKGIYVIITNPNNGEILALATDEKFNLNAPRDLSFMYSGKKINKMSDKEKSEAISNMWKNNVISTNFEPGSTMKPITISMALEENIVKENTEYTCDGGEDFHGTYVKCNGTHEKVTLTKAIAISCNDALMQIGKKIGSKTFLDYQNRFGFGQKTGIDLPNESSGSLFDEDKITEIDLACNAFGQNFTCNMTQMIAAFNSLVNEGNYYYTPHIVSDILNSKGGVVKTIKNQEVKQTITYSSSEFIKKALRSVVTEGTGKKAEIKGYQVGGKTGTAEKQPRGNDQYMLSFIGCVPYNNPEVSCYVVIDTPKEDPDDSGKAAQLFNNIMSEVLPYMNIYK